MEVGRCGGVAMSEYRFEDSSKCLDGIEKSRTTTRIVWYFMHSYVQIDVSTCSLIVRHGTPYRIKSTYPRPVSTVSCVGAQRTLFTRETFATIGLC